jgi:hypothetical protein
MKRFWMTAGRLVVVLWLIAGAACNTGTPEFTSSPTPSPTPSPTGTPTLTPTLTPTATLTETLTPTATPEPCYSMDVPASWEYTLAISQARTFAEKNQLTLRVITYPLDCSEEQLRQDLLYFYYRQPVDYNELWLLVLPDTLDGPLGALRYHLIYNGFWAMGPEDYPKLLVEALQLGDQAANLPPARPNVIMFRRDRLDGAWGEDTPDIMRRLIEHEYIHTVQGRNNPKLSVMIWDEFSYRAFIERYANLGNNSSDRYSRGTVTFYALLLFLDTLNQQGTLEGKVQTFLQGMDTSLQEYLDHKGIVLIDMDIKQAILEISGEKYLQRISQGIISPYYMIVLAGSGNVQAYNLIKQLYEENVDEFNVYYYGYETKKYLPSTWDQLFTDY